MYKVKLDGEDGSTFCLIGLENQSSFDVHMLIRAGIASLLIYDWKLSLKEEMKPVIIVVLNMSDRKWGGKLKLEDYFSKSDLEVLGPLMVNVEMLVIDPHTMGEEFEGLTTDLELILKVIKNKSDKRAFYDYIKSERRFACVISEKMEWPFRNSGMLFRNKRNEESFWSKARPFKSYSEASFC